MINVNSSQMIRALTELCEMIEGLNDNQLCEFWTENTIQYNTKRKEKVYTASIKRNIRMATQNYW